MVDREKVIRRIEYILNENKMDDGFYLPVLETVEVLEDALSLLKEQEPIAPKLIKMYPHDIYECGNCGHRSVGSKDYKAKYCPECGQAVKWNEAL